MKPADVAPIVQNTRFPPSFDDSAVAYGFALFGTTLVSSLALALLARFALEYRHRRKLDIALHNETNRGGNGGRGHRLVDLYRFKLSLLLATITVGALPDVLVLLAWGEASDSFMWGLFMLDRVFDGLAVIPFLGFVVTILLSGETVAHRLALDNERAILRLQWARVRDKASVVALSVLIAIGVTLYKAGL